MRYHAHALAANGVDVDLVGLEGTPLPREITDEPRITVHRLPIPRLKIRGELTGSTYAVAGLFDAFRISFRLWRTLRTLRRPELVLVQNPPAFPTLAVTWFTLRHKGVRFVIDWHNLGYTLLQLRLGRWHPAVRLARWYERRDARMVDANLCVSRGLAAFLESRFDVTQAQVLYDRPASAFTPIERAERERFRLALFARLGIRANTVGFIVCPTSWTEDEDFDVVIEAVMRLEERIRGWEAGDAGRRFPDLVILVTGDGARRAEFERRFAGLPARRIQLRARFLEPEDYPRVVGSADLGLCLHRSSSGLDIPMKIADLFGAGVPVCALDYGPCLREVLRPGETGMLFSTAAELSAIVTSLLARYPNDTSDLDRLRGGVGAAAATRWQDEWRRVAMATVLPLR